jgi:hypothetical protein
MPAINLTTDEIHAVAEYIHSVWHLARRGITATRATGDELLVGTPRRDAYFESKAPVAIRPRAICGVANRIHAVTKHVVAGGAARRRNFGQCNRCLEFWRKFGEADRPMASSSRWSWRTASRSFPRAGDVPKVEFHDPREGHRKLLPLYTDKDIHDVTAYMVTLK